MGVTHIMDRWWGCHVCRDRRPDSKISVVAHRHYDGYGHEIIQNVRYCNDRPACQRQAFVRDHTTLTNVMLHEDIRALGESLAHARMKRTGLLVAVGLLSGGLGCAVGFVLGTIA